MKRNFIVVVALFVAFMMAGCTTEKKSQEKFLETFFTTNDQGRYDRYVQESKEESSKAMEEAILTYHDGLKSLVSKEGMEVLLRNRDLVRLDKAAYDHKVSTAVSEVKLEKSGPTDSVLGGTTWNFTIKVKVLDTQKKEIGETLQTGTVVTLEEEGKEKVRSFYFANIKELLEMIAKEK